jgi:hypothetical protein
MDPGFRRGDVGWRTHDEMPPSAASSARATGARKGFEALYGFSTLKTVAIHHG